MTTKFLDNKICTFKILLSWRFPRKATFLDNSPLDPHAQPPQRCKMHFYCHPAISDTSWCCTSVFLQLILRQVLPCNFADLAMVLRPSMRAAIALWAIVLQLAMGAAHALHTCPWVGCTPRPKGVMQQHATLRRALRVRADFRKGMR